MKKFLIFSLVLGLGISLIGTFGCTTKAERKGNVYWDRPGGYVSTMDKSIIKKLNNFTYRIKERGARNYYQEIYYTNNEPTINPQSGNLIIWHAYVKKYHNAFYDRETKEFLGYACCHYPEVEITNPYTIIKQK